MVSRASIASVRASKVTFSKISFYVTNVTKCHDLSSLGWERWRPGSVLNPPAEAQNARNPELGTRNWSKDMLDATRNTQYDPYFPSKTVLPSTTVSATFT
jgi:hypothetical protein